MGIPKIILVKVRGKKRRVRMVEGFCPHGMRGDQAFTLGGYFYCQKCRAYSQ